MKKIFLVLTATLILSSCSKTLLITQGEQGYAGELNEKYELVELNTVSTSAKSFFGIGRGANNKDGVITNFVRSNITYPQQNFIRVLTLLSYSAILPIFAAPNILFGHVLGGIAVGGAVNNIFWNKTSLNAAMRSANKKLIEENPSIDLFIYPKYNIQRRNSLFTNKTNVNIISKGAKLKNFNVKDIFNIDTDFTVDKWKLLEVEDKEERFATQRVKREKQLEDLLRKGVISKEEYYEAKEELKKIRYE